MNLNYTTTITTDNGTIFRATIAGGFYTNHWLDGSENDVTLSIIQADGNTVDVKLTRAGFEELITHYYRSLGIN